MATIATSYTPFIATFFTKPTEETKLLDFIQTKLPIYVAQRSPKIKPVAGSQHLYELKVHIGADFYRLAYRYEANQIQALYLTKTLRKVHFDREVLRFLRSSS